MKIEKISSSQIRCILTEEDLASRQLRLSELAYGSEKARALFRDMMEQAAVQCGFDAENYPLMIEAIPLGANSIVLIVTKVDNPEELDTRFSNFAPSVQKNAAPAQDPPSPLSQLLRSIRENSAHDSSEKAAPESRLKDAQTQSVTKLFSFDTMSDAVRASHALAPAYRGESALYRDEKSGRLYLMLRMENIREFSKMRSVIAAFSEYGNPEKGSPARIQYLITHCTVVCGENALGTLAQI